MNSENTLIPIAPSAIVSKQPTAFSSIDSFESAQRMAKALATSNMVPQAYQNRIDNCLVAMELASRTGSSVLAVMQSVDMIHGKPSWRSNYIIGAVNSCGRFSPLRFKMDGVGDSQSCVAFATDRESGEIVEGPPCSIAMAKAEGWYGRNGSKWPTMPDLMLKYRAATYFGRIYAPDILLGMQSEDEIRDITPARVVQDQPQPNETSLVDAANAAARSTKQRSRRPRVIYHEQAQNEPAPDPITGNVEDAKTVGSVSETAAAEARPEVPEFF